MNADGDARRSIASARAAIDEARRFERLKNHA